MDVRVGSGGGGALRSDFLRVDTNILTTDQQMAALYLKVQADRSKAVRRCLLLCDLFCPLQFLDTHFEEKTEFLAQSI